MESYKTEINRLEAQVVESQFAHNEDKMKYDNKLNSLVEENNNYKKIVEQLKQKIKELSNRGGVDTKDFLETFEEVMKEEMMTMKNAFEGKLRNARAESEETARRHQVEIARMQSALSSSPSAALLLNNRIGSIPASATKANKSNEWK